MTPAVESPAGADTRLHVLYVHFGGAAHDEEKYTGILALLTGFTPVVQPLPPDAALADVRGALRYFQLDAAGLALLVRLRVAALHGIDCTVGVAANPLLARMAAYAAPSGTVRVLWPGEEAAFLERRPVVALHGVGPATARTLCSYGLDTVGRVAAAPPATLQRILGATAGRRLLERARGIDPTPVVVPGTGTGTGAGSSTGEARSASSEYRFGHDELDPDVRRRALLTLAHELGSRMRTDGRVTRVLTLTVRYADRSTTTRTRTLAEPTAHTPALTTTAYALHDALGLQRARVRGVSLRAEEFTESRSATRQLSFDPREERARSAEAAADRARARFGEAAVHPAGLLGAA